MRSAFKVLLIAGALVATGLGTLAPAGATTSPPGIQTTNFVCNNGVCAVGPGNVGMPFAAAMIGTGGPFYAGPECNAYLMKVVGGSLPSGLKLSEPICEWEITGTPTATGTFTFTVQIAPQPNSLGQSAGPDGTQQFSITIGTGRSDRLVLTGAIWSPHSVNKTLQIAGFDVNNSATYTVYVTSTGAELGTITEPTPDNGGDGTFTRNFREVTDLNNLTVTDSLGGSATIPVTLNNKYS
jgi:Putative Ig domain